MTIKINMQGIFGDFYVMTFATLAGGRRTETGVEIEDENFVDVIRIAKEVAEVKEERRKNPKKQEPIMILPMSGNDKKPFEKVLRCLNIPTQSTISEILSKVNVDMAEKCEKVSAMSFIKPDMYEYGRVPGYEEGKNQSRKSEIKIDALYLITSVAGWVLSRLGEASSEGSRVGVHIFPIDVSQSFHNLPVLMEKVDRIPGLYPTTAFLLWLSYQMIKNGALITDAMQIYTMSDAGGMSPATVKEGYRVSLERIVNRLNGKLGNDQNYLERLTSDAMSPKSETRSFSIRVCNLLYEVIMGSKRETDLLYFANRELYSINVTKSDESSKDLKEKNKLEVYRAASKLAYKFAGQ
ncbi:type I-A CRISPR-associated protein CsaX [Metallosphaera cuprina]|uniref:Uncharacterized protein n=1 Tax=Metallosphaera cuprina (strain Ar-4) TaxID=1006006 RepID=F4G362_METCR|nr:type I-A CRISPR-associated protein CsaX [Metallosphaera cuprina]AEB95260.1 conserved hypothetical protein [Metallosphaera cuprina Ar-4]